MTVNEIIKTETGLLNEKLSAEAHDDSEKYEQALHLAMVAAEEVHNTLTSPGWVNYIRPTLQKIVRELNNIDDIKTIRDLEARKQTYSAMKKFQQQLDNIIDTGNQAVQELQQIKNGELDVEL